MRALLWPARLGEPGVKKSATEHGIAERHLMMTQAHQAHPELSVQRLCELFEVSRSWYYEHLKQPEDDAEEIALRDRIEQIILEFSGYGYRRVTHALAREGWRVNHKRVLRIMQEESLLCHLKKRFVIATTNSRHRFPIYPNMLAAMVLERPDQAWVADLTYIRLLKSRLSTWPVFSMRFPVAVLAGISPVR